MSDVVLFPESTSTYSINGVQHHVPCTIAGQARGATAKIECPNPFVLPIDPNNAKSCVGPCPPPAYTHDEYSLMWMIFSVIGLLGFLLNIFMAATWTISGKRHFKDIAVQLKACVGFGLLYGLTSTLPVVCLKFDLPCSCETEEW
jgi:hypothetical protein